MSKVTIVIPARYASTRFPGKPLAMLCGKPMLQWVWEGAKSSKLADHVIVATDDKRIHKAASDFGASCDMTSPDHPSGTDRVAEVALIDDGEIFVNVQGDEPLIRGDVIDAVIRPLLDDPAVNMTSAYRKFAADEDPSRPDTVKVVCGLSGDALYFSRSPVPFYRESPPQYLLHVGIYAYRKPFLMTLSKLSPTPLENAEKLEQLRVLEHGYPIRMVEVNYHSLGVDRPEDLAGAEAILLRGAPS